MSARLTNELLGLDIRRLVKQGLLNAGTCCTVTWKGRTYSASIDMDVHANAATLRYNANSERHCYDIAISTTPCHLGGQRQWWRCSGCNKRCAILYGGAVFVCRKCAGLHYPIQHASTFGKAIIRAEAIRYRLGWQPGIAHGKGSKPKGMHWKTYRALALKHDYYANSSVTLLEEKFHLSLDKKTADN